MLKDKRIDVVEAWNTLDSPTQSRLLGLNVPAHVLFVVTTIDEMSHDELVPVYLCGYIHNWMLLW